MVNVQRKHTLKIIQIYAQTMHLKHTTSDFDEELEQFYVKLESVLKDPATYTIIQGDFKAKFGKIRDNEEGEFL